VILADIGNRYAHIYFNNKIEHLEIDNFLQRFKDKELFYICVNSKVLNRVKNNKKWTNIAPFAKLDGAYKGMGIDRVVLALSKKDAILIDAGSAITIDVVKNSKFLGGAILPGIWKTILSYKEISSALEIKSLDKIDIDKLPNKSTQQTISYSVIAPIVALVEKINSYNLPIFCCGGDGELLSKYIKNSTYKEDLVFDGMKNVIKEIKC